MTLGSTPVLSIETAASAGLDRIGIDRAAPAASPIKSERRESGSSSAKVVFDSVLVSALCRIRSLAFLSPTKLQRRMGYFANPARFELFRIRIAARFAGANDAGGEPALARMIQRG
jgi:hypothetical protein